MTVHVVTDSTADLPPELAQGLGITVVPLNVHFGEQSFQDGLEITPDDFYQRLLASPRPPTTSQPSVGAFLDTYQRLGKEADGIVSVHISAKLSGTCNSALQAREELAGSLPVEVVDTGQASLGLGLVAMATARAAQGGADIAETQAEARRAMEQVSVLFMVDTLEYLQKGGRIGKGAAFLGGILNVKPLLCIHDGEVHPLERARTRSKAVDRLVELVQEEAPYQELAVMHTTTPDAAQELAQRLAPCVPGGQVLVGQLGSVVGTYAGPGLLGVSMRRVE